MNIRFGRTLAVAAVLVAGLVGCGNADEPKAVKAAAHNKSALIFFIYLFTSGKYSKYLGRTCSRTTAARFRPSGLTSPFTGSIAFRAICRYNSPML